MRARWVHVNMQIHLRLTGNGFNWEQHERVNAEANWLWWIAVAIKLSSRTRTSTVSRRLNWRSCGCFWRQNPSLQVERTRGHSVVTDMCSIALCELVFGECEIAFPAERVEPEELSVKGQENGVKVQYFVNNQHRVFISRLGKEWTSPWMRFFVRPSLLHCDGRTRARCTFWKRFSRARQYFPSSSRSVV